MMISDTKIGETFPGRQFHIEGYTPCCRLDRSFNGGSIMNYVREDIRDNLAEISNSVEKFFIELKLRKKKRHLCGLYNPHKSFISQLLSKISKNLDTFLTKYDNVFLTGDFNVDKNDASLKDFCKKITYKNLMLINSHRSLSRIICLL